jgi:hypothetical protein
MESAGNNPSNARGVSIIGACAGMLVTFIAGIVVGLHPTWVPFYSSADSNINGKPIPLPSMSHMDDHPGIATQPAGATSTAS